MPTYLSDQIPLLLVLRGGLKDLILEARSHERQGPSDATSTSVKTKQRIPQPILLVAVVDDGVDVVVADASATEVEVEHMHSSLLHPTAPKLQLQRPNQP